MRNLAASLISAAACLAAAVVSAQPTDDARRLAAVLEQTTSYRADFAQRVTDANGQLIEEGGGRFWLARPDRFRWEYRDPWPRLLVSDGVSVWLFDEELEQATVRDAEGLIEQTPAGILAGRRELLDEFAVTAEYSGGVSRMRLTPLDGGDFSRIELEFDGDTLVGLLLEDQFGQRTRIEFSAITVNEAADRGVFEFVLPAGADLIDERATADRG